MTFSPQFLDELRARASLSGVIGGRVQLTKHGREHKGLCPFHKEKTPSFTVNEDKGFFHCFGCGAHGDVIGFVMQSDGLSFPEAVEKLAADCGLPIPVQSPDERRRQERRAGLYDIVEMAATWFEGQLAGPDGAAARHYLADRGLDAATIAHFRLGFAPDRKAALKSHLCGQDIDEGVLVSLGLLRRPDDNQASYDFFRGRIMFPIADSRGRVIAFGGRALGDFGPKYINSPESDLFQKGAALYNYAGARTAARDAGTVIVGEGYMDVIALHRHGFAHAVAPLGTALTERQLELLWRLASEPVICLDGDTAGRKAAVRAAERALQVLRAGHSLRFAFLPAGEDPDSVLQADGPEALRDIVGRAQRLVDFLWDREMARQPADTPERRAGLRQRLNRLTSEIHDPELRRLYTDEFRSRFDTKFRAQPAAGRGWGRYQPPVADISLMRHALGSDARGDGRAQEQNLIAGIVIHTQLLSQVVEEFTMEPFKSRHLDELRRIILEIFADDPHITSDRLIDCLRDRGHGDAVDSLVRPQGWGGRRMAGVLDPEMGIEEVEAAWRETLALHRSRFEVDQADIADGAPDASSA